MATKRCACGTFIKEDEERCFRCENNVGYNYCACETCFETIIGRPDEYCDDCIRAGCDQERTIGQSTECLVCRCECGVDMEHEECCCEEGE